MTKPPIFSAEAEAAKAEKVLARTTAWMKACFWTLKKAPVILGIGIASIFGIKMTTDNQKAVDVAVVTTLALTAAGIPLMLGAVYGMLRHDRLKEAYDAAAARATAEAAEKTQAWIASGCPTTKTSETPLIPQLLKKPFAPHQAGGQP